MPYEKQQFNPVHEIHKDSYAIAPYWFTPQ